ncbi:hypothetical protein [Haliangium sp. UPWRP_2]|uniref:DUF6896 domain-containing protein n=1 Tax=Haliangium sp. UPWRP_2 TaxID=1931276 RepID=UPI000B543DD5|nr:hypothetical protein [Haliangium sp. UPWRP_2]PSM30878.1 hypothetical protein BVG81_008265 [Haliangium sp. UPWRP_2]
METERTLIREYLAAVHKVVSALRAGLGYQNLLAAYHQRKIPKEGVINGVEFSFHGIGCQAVVDGLEVDFDFGVDDRIDGFEPWRLWRFAEQQPETYPQFRQVEDVKKAMERLERSGEIECSRAMPSSTLWYLRS